MLLLLFFYYLLRISILVRPSFCAYQVLGSIAYTRHLVCHTLYFSFTALRVQLRGKQCVYERKQNKHTREIASESLHINFNIFPFSIQDAAEIFTKAFVQWGLFFPNPVVFHSLAPHKCFQQSLLGCVNRCTSQACMYQQ